LRELGGDVTVQLGQPLSLAVANLHAGLRIAESLGDRATESDLLARLAVNASARLAFNESIELGGRAVRAARASGEDRALAAALDGLKTGYAYLGEIALLAPIIVELEPLLRRQGDLWRLPWTVEESSFSAIAAGRWDEALERIAAIPVDAALDQARTSLELAVDELSWSARMAEAPNHSLHLTPKGFASGLAGRCVELL